ncbi:MAG: hypothetical protein IPJ75_12585 [Ignavibacteriales bacterium]|nr:hypothetical protein [Ignavibacteriales bacterium]
MKTIKLETKHLLNLLLVITSLLGYLEWGKDERIFLLEGEILIISKLFTDFTSVIHPFILLPMAGQILLIVTLFQKSPSRLLTYLGLGSIGILLFFMFLIGLLSLNYKIFLSTIPFLVTGFFVIMKNRKQKTEKILSES